MINIPSTSDDSVRILSSPAAVQSQPLQPVPILIDDSSRCPITLLMSNTITSLSDDKLNALSPSLVKDHSVTIQNQ